MRTLGWLACSVVALTAAAAGACVGDPPETSAPSDAGASADTSTVEPIADAGDERRSADAGPCALDAPFGKPLLVPGLESPGDDDAPALSSDELDIFFTRTPPLQNGTSAGIFHASRASLRAAFGPATVFLDRPGAFDGDPFVTLDGKTVFGALAGAPSSLGGADIYRLRADGGAMPVTGVNTDKNDGNPFLTADGNELWYVREVETKGGDGGTFLQTDIFRSRYDDGVAREATSVAELNVASADEHWPVLSADLKTIYFASKRREVVPDSTRENVWVARRASVDVPFDPPQPVPALNSADNDAARWLSPDGCRIYLRSDRSGNEAIYMAERPR